MGSDRKRICLVCGRIFGGHHTCPKPVLAGNGVKGTVSEGQRIGEGFAMIDLGLDDLAQEIGRPYYLPENWRPLI